MQDFEKLGSFYLGRLYDLDARKPQDTLLLYDSKDLVTHAVCVGMTGSGKTGLCLGLLEEAAIDGIPAVVIDPKGDLSNLLLTFPALDQASFAPWINEDEARMQGIPAPDFAAQQAERWKKGLADWGQDGARIQRMRDMADFAVYTPGSEAGIPVSIVQSFAAPEEAVRQDRELLREQITATTTSLLGLLGMDADPIQSREHVLISALLDTAWRNGGSLDLASLIAQIQKPPFPRIGVMDLESFYPSKDRFALAMAINTVIASPGFEAWLHGEPLNVDRFLFTTQGKPRISIFSIAHLNDAERMFFVSMLLNQMVSWMRRQTGTSSLRAILYMDEIFGYFPPVSNPPSKRPLLTLLKQARAFGLGTVLATQNPVDLDYKGLANCGTWFIGRLQTERDKARVLDGLEGAAAEAGAVFSRERMEQILSSLGSRVFLMNNVHDDVPVVFQTRWTLSYLRGPLSRTQIKQLMQSRNPDLPVSGDRARTVSAAVSTAAPVMPAEIRQYFLPAGSGTQNIVYQPALIGCAKLQFVDARLKVDEARDLLFLTPLEDGPLVVNWDNAGEASIRVEDLSDKPCQGATFGDLPSPATQPKSYAAWTKDFANWIYRSQTLQLYRCPAIKETSRPGESERDFRIHVQQRLREERDVEVEALRKKYAPKLQALEERKRMKEQALEKERLQSKQVGLETVLSVGSGLLGAFMGRKTFSATNLNRAASAARAINRTRKESTDITRAEENVQAIEQQIHDLEEQFQSEVDALSRDTQAETVETISVRLKKTNVSVQFVALAWVP